MQVNETVIHRETGKTGTVQAISGHRVTVRFRNGTVATLSASTLYPVSRDA